jgi:hypothetical protein
MQAQRLGSVTATLPTVRKLPEISPIFIAELVAPAVSRERDKEIALGRCRMGRYEGRSAGRLRGKLAAWHDTPAMLKMLRLAEHIEWAAKHDSSEAIGRFFRELREEDGYHIGE